jgi:hypothetical protein
MRTFNSHQPAQRSTVVSLNGDMVVKNGKRSGMLSLLMCDEATEGYMAKSIQSELASVLTVVN